MTIKKSLFKHAALTASVAVAGGYVAQAGCIPFALESAASAADLCFVFDCQNGLFGGTIDPCDPDDPILADCPNL